MGFALLSAAWVTGPAAPPAAMESLEVTIVVDNLRSARGRVQIALWSGPDGFADGDAAILKAGLPARPGAVRFTIPGLAPGRYAVASYHDGTCPSPASISNKTKELSHICLTPFSA